MSSETLEILAIEPYYTGARRLMLETLARHSRHHWTILRLPGRRIERRLEAAAQWFAEVILRRPPMTFDLLFTSEAINLPELYQLCPEISGHPAVVYFHDNQLPTPGRALGRPVDPVNLLTALEGTELWFNSLYHLRSFTGRAMGVLHQFSHLFPPDALAKITEHSRLVPPPVDITRAAQSMRAAYSAAGGRPIHGIPQAAAGGLARESVPAPHRIFVDLRQADLPLLTDSLAELRRRGESFELFTIGPRGGLPADVARTALPEHDEDAATAAMGQCDTFLSVQTDCAFDPRAIIALSVGLPAAVPDCGAYQDLIPDELKSHLLYQPRPQFLASKLQDLWSAATSASPPISPLFTAPTSSPTPEPPGPPPSLVEALNPYEAEKAVTGVDWRLEQLIRSYTPDPPTTPQGTPPEA